MIAASRRGARARGVEHARRRRAAHAAMLPLFERSLRAAGPPDDAFVIYERIGHAAFYGVREAADGPSPRGIETIRS